MSNLDNCQCLFVELAVDRVVLRLLFVCIGFDHPEAYGLSTDLGRLSELVDSMDDADDSCSKLEK